MGIISNKATNATKTIDFIAYKASNGRYCSKIPPEKFYFFPDISTQMVCEDTNQGGEFILSNKNNVTSLLRKKYKY